MRVFCGDNFKKRYNKGNSRPPAEGRLSKQKTKQKKKKIKKQKVKQSCFTSSLYTFFVGLSMQIFYFLQEKRFEK